MKHGETCETWGNMGTVTGGKHGETWGQSPGLGETWGQSPGLETWGQSPGFVEQGNMGETWGNMGKHGDSHRVL